MNDVSNRLHLCFAWEDLARIRQIILETEHEIGAKIFASPTGGAPSQLDDETNDHIADSEVFIVFISNAAKKSDFVRQCVVRATHLNKNIIPVEIDRQAMFGAKMPPEFKFRSKTYDFIDPQSKAEFFAQLKASMGFSVEEGDAFGAIVHIVSDREARIRRYGDIIGVAKPDTDCKIRLAKGAHQLQFQAVEDSSLLIYQTIEITDNEAEQFISIPLDRLIREKQEREELERFRAETRMQLEKERIRQSLELQEQRRREAGQADQTSAQSQSQLSVQEKLRAREEKFRIDEEYSTDADEVNGVVPYVLKWILGIAFIIILVSIF